MDHESISTEADINAVLVGRSLYHIGFASHKYQGNDASRATSKRLNRNLFAFVLQMSLWTY